MELVKGETLQVAMPSMSATEKRQARWVLRPPSHHTEETATAALSFSVFASNRTSSASKRPAGLGHSAVCHRPGVRQRQGSVGRLASMTMGRREAGKGLARHDLSPSWSVWLWSESG